MSNLKASGIWAAVLCYLPVAIYAHHARFEYDDSDLVEVQGTVTSVFWRNSHVRFVLSAVGENGDGELWEMEGGSVNTLQRQGIDSDILDVGDHIKVFGLLSRRDDRALLPIYLTLANGRDVVMLHDRARSFGLIAESTEPALLLPARGWLRRSLRRLCSRAVLARKNDRSSVSSTETA